MGQNLLFFAYFWPILGPGNQHKYLNRSKHTLAHPFLSYMTLKSHWRYLSTKLRQQNWIFRIFGAKSTIFAYFWPILCPGYQHKDLNRSKHKLAHQFLSQMALKSYWRCISTKLRQHNWIFKIWGVKSAIFCLFLTNFLSCWPN